MKYIVIAVLGYLYSTTTLAQPAVLIAVYDFDTIASPVSATTGAVRPSYVNYLVLSSAGNFGSTGVSQVSGGFFSSGHTPPAGSRARIASSWSQTLNTGKYMSFTLTVVSGQVLVIDSINYYSAKSNQGPDSTRMRTSADAYAANSWYSLNIGDVSWRRSSRTTGLPTSAFPIQFRFYSYYTGPVFNSAGTWRIDKVRIYGHLQNVFNLPIELLSFTGHKTLDGVQLDWTTATERENDYFTLLRSANAENYEPIGFVDGAGNSTSAISYSFVDDEPLPGLNYYQLKQTDWNGDSTLSHVVAVQFQEVGTLNYPVGSWVSWDGKPTTQLDVLGRRTGNVSVQHFFDKPGIYFLQTQVGETVRLVIHTP